MYRFLRQQSGGFQTFAVSVAVVYLAITSLIPLLHSDDCPDSPGAGGRERSAPSDSPCPACKFLAGSSSTEVQYDTGPVLMESQVPPESAQDSNVVVANLCTGSILLRAPPKTPLT
jgi:hypothetical protein